MNSAEPTAVLRARVEALAEDLAGQLPPEAREAVDQARDLLRLPYYLVVCGEYAQGKSTLLNALVRRRPGLFPGDGRATSVPTTLAWGEQERAVAITMADPDTGAPGQRLEIGIGEVADYVTEEGNPDNARRVALVQMFAPVPQLESGLVLVDTPGISSLRETHTEATYGFLKSADAVLFVTGSRDPLSSYELAFLRDVVAECPTFAAVVARVDDVPDPNAVVDDARAKIAEAVAVNRARVKIMPVSAFRAFDADEYRDESLRQRSNLPDLHKMIAQLTAGCQQARISAALSVLADTFRQAAAPVANAWEDLATGEPDRESLERLRLNLNNLRRGGSAWLADLDDEFRGRAKVIGHDLAGAFQRLTMDIRTQNNLYDDDQDPDEIVQRVQRRMIDAVAAADGALGDLCAAIVAEVAAKAQIELVTARVTDVFWAPPRVVREHTALGSPPVRPTDTLRKSVGTGAAVAGVGGTIGGIVGGLVAPGAGNAVGAVVGAVIGHLTGWVVVTWDQMRTARVQYRRDNAHRLTQQLPKTVEAAAKEAEREFAGAAERRLDAVRKTVRAGIDRDCASLERSIELLTRSQRSDANSRSRLRTDLAPQHELHRKLSQRLSALGDEADALHREPH